MEEKSDKQCVCVRACVWRMAYLWENAHLNRRIQCLWEKTPMQHVTKKVETRKTARWTASEYFLLVTITDKIERDILYPLQ